ncbi:nicotinamide N-methyltransferase-like isoform X2 [Dermacentor albipictus]|uniref:nicotinamide N-methyltransferase-like isoform X2 n=1 Tax=Dermacentor albipictus TaxID=60249 RepID=UPI0038FC48BA
MDQEQLVAKILDEFSPENYPAHSVKMLPLLNPILQEMHSIFTSELVKGGILLEVGCGPCMYTAMAASVAFEHIVMADLVPANILEVRKWVDAAPDAKDWTLFAQRLAVIEGHAWYATAYADALGVPTPSSSCLLGFLNPSQVQSSARVYKQQSRAHILVRGSPQYDAFPTSPVCYHCGRPDTCIATASSDGLASGDTSRRSVARALASARTRSRNT